MCERMEMNDRHSTSHSDMASNRHTPNTHSYNAPFGTRFVSAHTVPSEVTNGSRRKGYVAEYHISYVAMLMCALSSFYGRRNKVSQVNAQHPAIHTYIEKHTYPHTHTYDKGSIWVHTMSGKRFAKVIGMCSRIPRRCQTQRSPESNRQASVAFGKYITSRSCVHESILRDDGGIKGVRIERR